MPTGVGITGSPIKRTGSSPAGDSIQKTVMPAASAALLGKIYEYVGETTSSFTNGFFYECVLDHGSYVWASKMVQPSIASGAFPAAMHLQPFNSTEELCAYFYENYPAYCIKGASYQGTFNVDDFPSSDHGGELILKCFGNDLMQLDFYSTNTEPHHWYTMYYDGSLQFQWMSHTPLVYDMPYPESQWWFKIVQYMGDTDGDYVHGCFYECQGTIEGGIFNWVALNVCKTKSGTTANRPSSGEYVGEMYFNTTDNKPEWWSGSAWVRS